MQTNPGTRISASERYAVQGDGERFSVVDTETMEVVSGKRPLTRSAAEKRAKELNRLHYRLPTQTVAVPCLEDCGGYTVVFAAPAGEEPVRRVCDACIERQEAEEAAKRREFESAHRKRSIASLMEGAGVNAREYGHCTLESFNPDPDRMALKRAYQFVQAFLAGRRPRIYFWSQRPDSSIAPGSGKTHLAHGILHSLMLEPDVPPASLRYVFVPALIREARAAIKTQGVTVQDVIQKYTTPELLVWDDFGAGGDWRFAEEEVIFPLLEARGGRSDIFTSNDPIEKMEWRSEYAPRIASRLARAYSICLTGPDRRQRTAL